MMGVQIIEPRSGGQHQEIVQQVHGLARRAGLSTMPEGGRVQQPRCECFCHRPLKKQLFSGRVERLAATNAPR